MEVICRHCGARNTSGGHCMMCHKQMGSIRKAVKAAVISAVILTVMWVGCATFLKFQFTWFAAVFGGVISGSVAIYSKGFGIRFQAIATTATVAALIIADTLVVYINWELFFPNWGSQPPPPFWELMIHQVKYDGITAAFLVLGVMGGFVIWRSPD